MNNTYCLNCGESVSYKFCSHCGQKKDTHRLTFKHFFMHDILHGMWHMEKGILFTIKETFTRPGQAALDYIHGKRIRYYNVFYLILLTTALSVSLAHFFEHYVPQPEVVDSPIKLQEFINENLKFLLIAMLPFLAFNGYAVMDRMHLNLTEHFIVAGITLLGCILLTIPNQIFAFIDNLWPNTLCHIINKIGYLLIFIFPAFVYINLSRKKYKWYDYLWRMPIFYFMLYTQMAIAIVILRFLNTI